MKKLIYETNRKLLFRIENVKSQTQPNQPETVDPNRILVTSTDHEVGNKYKMFLSYNSGELFVTVICLSQKNCKFSEKKLFCLQKSVRSILVTSFFLSFFGLYDYKGQFYTYKWYHKRPIRSHNIAAFTFSLKRSGTK